MSKIKDLRLKAGLTQQQLFELLEIPMRTIQSWETEKRTPPKWAENLICEKLETIIKQNNENG